MNRFINNFIAAIVFSFGATGSIAQTLGDVTFTPKDIYELQFEIDTATRELNKLTAKSNQMAQVFKNARNNLNIHSAAVRSKTQALLAHSSAQTNCPTMIRGCETATTGVYADMYCDQAKQCDIDFEAFQRFDQQTRILLTKLAPRILEMKNLLRDSEKFIMSNEQQRKGYEETVKSLDRLLQIQQNFEQEDLGQTPPNILQNLPDDTIIR